VIKFEIPRRSTPRNNIIFSISKNSISKELGFLSEENYQELRNEIEKIMAMINSLHKATNS
jgi:hypothetical protein